MSPCDPEDSSTLRSPRHETVEEEASAWVVRHDRGLNADETLEFQRWLRADECHAAAWKHATGTWGSLGNDELKTALPEPTMARAKWPAWLAAATAAAAVLAFVFLPGRPPAASAPGASRAAVAGAAVPEVRIQRLSDGTTVYLRGGDSEVIERFTPGERWVLLAKGEAHFDVAKNPEWPFIVRAGVAEVRAVGTAFDVSLRSSAVEVRVTEGRVRVGADAPAASSATAPDLSPLVEAGQRAIVGVAPGAPATVQVATMDAEELARTIAWRDPVVRVSGRTLEQVAAEFQRITGRRVELADPELKGLMLGGRVLPDNVDGLAQFLQKAYGLVPEHTPDGGLILHKAP